MSWSAWPAFWCGPVIVYLLNSIATLCSNRPALWILGAYYGLIFLLLIGVVGEIVGTGTMARQSLDGPFSLFATVAGPLLDPVTAPHYRLASGFWPLAVLFWLALAATALWLVAGRRRGN